MIELLEHPDLLRRPDLELPAHSLCGVPFGAPASAFPRARVVEATLASIVSSILFDKENDRPELYLDGKGDPIPLGRVVDSVLEQGEGVLHFAEQISFGLERGAVARFTLYGRALSPFGRQNVNALLGAFGRPDRLVKTEAHGDVLFLDAYYAGSKKWLRWDDRWRRLAFIALGGSRDDITTGTFGSLIRRDAA